MNSSFQRRLKTFRGWPAASCQLPETLAASGFAYEGTGDRVTCSTCRVRLYDWVACDPLVQHGKFSEHKCELYQRIKRQRNGAYENDSGNLDATGTSDGQESRVFAKTKNKNFKSQVSSRETAGASRLAVDDLQKIKNKDLLPFSRECVDTESPTIFKSIAATFSVSARSWTSAMEQAYLDREELLLLQRHGVDRKRMLAAVRRRLNAGLDILSDPDGLRRELLS